MNKPAPEKTIEQYLKHILAKYAEAFSAAKASEPQDVFSKDEYMELLNMVYRLTENEKDIKNTLGLLKSHCRDFIANRYASVLHVFKGLESEPQAELQFIEHFNRIEGNFRSLIRFIEKFFCYVDKKEIQKCYFLEGTSRQILEALFIENVISTFKHDIIKVIQKWFNQFSVEVLEPAVAQSMRLFLGSVARYIFSDVFLKEKLAKDMETTILNVMDVKMKKLIAVVSSLSTSQAIQESVAFKLTLKGNASAVFEEIPFFETIKAEIGVHLNKTVLQHILFRLKHNEFGEINAIIDSNNQRDLEGISILFTDSDDKIEDFKDFFINYISNTGTNLLKAPLPRFEEIDNFARFLTHMDDLIVRIFMNNKVLRYAKNKALEKTVEAIETLYNKSAKDFSRRFYAFLNLMISEQRPVTKTFDVMSDIASYLSPKAFLQYFSTSFVRRILDSRYIQSDYAYEDSILRLFESKMGEECCQHIEAVLKDVEAFQAEKLEKFEKFKKNLLLGPGVGEFNLTIVSSKNFDDHVLLKPPQSFRFFESIADTFFHSDARNDNKKLEFDYSCGLCQVSMELNNAEYLMEGCPLVFALLFSIAQNPRASASEITSMIVASSNLAESDLRKKINSMLDYLEKVGLVIQTEGPRYSVNKDFSSQEKYMRLVVPSEAQKDEAAQAAGAPKERYFELESKIMHLVKKGRRSGDELREAISSHVADFDLPAFRKSLNYLIQNEFVKRFPGSSDFYEYK